MFVKGLITAIYHYTKERRIAVVVLKMQAMNSR